MDITKIFYIITNILYVYTIYISLNTFLGNPRSKVISCLSYLLFYITDILIYFNIKISIVFTISSIVMYFLLTLCYLQKIYKKIIFTLIISVIAMLSEALGAGLLSLSNILIPVNPVYSLAYVMIFSRIFFYVVCYILINIYKRKTGRYISKIQLPAILLIISSIFIMYISFNFTSTIFEPTTAKANITLIIPSILVIALNISTFYTYEHKQHIYELEQHNNMLNNAIQIQQNQFMVEKKLREQFSKEKHDYKNYLISLQAELEQGKYDAVSASITKHIGLMSNKIYSDSGCYALDSIVNYKAEYAGEYGIDIKTKYRIEDELPIKSEDLCILFGVALDNAIEYLAAHRELKQEISLSANYAKGEFTFAISNPVAENIAIVNNTITSTKKTSGHGIGIDSASHIILKYDGSLQLSCKNKEFIFGACIFI